MAKKIFYLLSLFLGFNILFFVAGCCLHGGCCGGGTVSYFDVIDVSASNLERDDSINIFSGSFLPDQSVVAFDQFLIIIESEVEVFSSVNEQPSYNLSNPFITSAYACSPPPIESQPTEEVAGIFVFSNSDFITSTDIHPAGDTLNEFFFIGNGFENRQPISLDSYNSLTINESQFSQFLGLEESPNGPQEHQFTIHYYLTNGEFYTATTETVEITP